MRCQYTRDCGQFATASCRLGARTIPLCAAHVLSHLRQGFCDGAHVWWHGGPVEPPADLNDAFRGSLDGVGGARD